MEQEHQLVSNHSLDDPQARVSMKPFFERLLGRSFPDSVSAIEFCRGLCGEFGFTVKQEASANRNIYVYCSREGHADPRRNPKSPIRRKRTSKRCDCRWRVVLTENSNDQWVFRKSSNPNASEHNHDMLTPGDMVIAWPSQVTDLIVDLARQHLQTHQIREMVKQRFPDITWNERRFYNRLSEERKRIRQHGVLERTRRLVLLSTHLCALVASNEEWSDAVQGELSRMLDNMCRLSQLTPETLNSLVEFHNNKFQTETTGPSGTCTSYDADDDESSSSSAEMMLDEQIPSKKRKSISLSSNTMMVHIPRHTFYVQSQAARPPVDMAAIRHSVADGADAGQPVQGSSPVRWVQQTLSPLSNHTKAASVSPTSSSSSASSMTCYHPNYQRQFEPCSVASSPMNPSIMSSPHDPPLMPLTTQHHPGNFVLTPVANQAYPVPPTFPSYTMTYEFNTPGLVTAQAAPTLAASLPQQPHVRDQHGMSLEPFDPEHQPRERVSLSTSSSLSPRAYENYANNEESLDRQAALVRQHSQQQLNGHASQTEYMSIMHPVRGSPEHSPNDTKNSTTNAGTPWF